MKYNGGSGNQWRKRNGGEILMAIMAQHQCSGVMASKHHHQYGSFSWYQRKANIESWRSQRNGNGVMAMKRNV